MITLYGVYRSRASRPLWLLGEAEVPFTHVPVIQAYRLADAGAAEAPLNTASPSFLKVNPQGQIPVMEEDGLILTESLAITLYLAKRHGGALGPADLREDAMMTQWSLMAATAIEPHAIEILYALAGDPTATPGGMDRIAAEAEKLRRPFARLDAFLEHREWLVGGRFTVADINVAECVRYAQDHPTLLKAYPALSDWLYRCHHRPAFQAMWQRRLAEPA
jgi:glutathione S-transferase